MNADTKRLLEIAETFERAERMGLPSDMPEGSRYIGITDTLAKELTKELREIASRMNGSPRNLDTTGIKNLSPLHYGDTRAF